jgi:hypothetical protein
MKSLGHLACRLTHNLNQLLTLVKGYAELVPDQLSRAAPLRGDVE